MTAKLGIIQPTTDANITSNATTAGVTAWSATTRYNVGTSVSSGHKTYLSKSAYAKSSLVNFDAATDVVTYPNHGMANGDAVYTLNSTDPLIVDGTTYFVIQAALNTFKLATTVGGAAINVTVNSTQTVMLYGQANYNKAVTDTTYWTDTGTNNIWAMFDFYSSLSTTRASPLTVVQNCAGFTDNGFVNTVYLMNMSGVSSATIVATDSGAGVVYNKTVDLNDYSAIENWWDYFFTPIIYKRDLLLSDLPPYGNMSVSVSLSGPGTVGVQNAVFASSAVLGAVQKSAGVGIENYSKDNRDDYGNISPVKRGFNKIGDFSLWVDNEKGDMLENIFIDYRATPALWIMDENYMRAVILGLYQSFKIALEQVSYDIYTLSLKGVGQ